MARAGIRGAVQAIGIAVLLGCGTGEDRGTELPFDPRPAVPRRLDGPVASLADWIAGDSPRWQCRYLTPVPPPGSPPSDSSSSAAAAERTLRAQATGMREPIRVCQSVQSKTLKFLVVAPGDTVLGITRLETARDSAAVTRFEQLAAEIRGRHGQPLGSCEVQRPDSVSGAPLRQRITVWRVEGQPLSLVLQAARDGDRVVVAAGAAAASCEGAGPAASTLERAARQVVGFLRGDVLFDSVALADTVELRIAPEGGGARRRVAREALRNAAAWTIGDGARRVGLVPAAGYGVIATAVGRHYRCQVQQLAPLAPDWARKPHVGVRLQPEGATSCLQSWNATFVFDTTQGGPRLAGVLFDQWEW